jgi:hypothetical protein
LTTETVSTKIVLMPFSGQLTQDGSGTRERLPNFFNKRTKESRK